MTLKRKSARGKKPKSSPEGTDRSRAQAEQARRQSELLDEALMETFPASDPVSVFHLT
jgi:hypothetical protein